MFANTQMMGMSLGGPDVCLTPPVPAPVPYPNLAIQPMGVPAAYNVLLGCAPAHHLVTTVPMTNGDNTGIALGVASGTVMGPSRHLTASFTFLVGGIPATRMTSITLTNSTNAPGVSIVPSQVKVLVLAP
jgi:hypothetical protein